MAKFTVPKSGYDFTLPQSLPVQPADRALMFKQMGAMTVSGDEFALVDGGLALHCVDGRFKKKDLRGKRVIPSGHLGLVVLSGDGKRICSRLLSILTGGVEVTADEPAQGAQPIQVEDSASGVVERVDRDAWLPLLPAEFRDIRVNGLFSLDHVIYSIRSLGPNILEFLRRTTERDFRDHSFALHAVFHIDRNPEMFKPYQDLILPRWDAWVKTAQAALRMGKGILK